MTAFTHVNKNERCKLWQTFEGSMNEKKEMTRREFVKDATIAR